MSGGSFNYLYCKNPNEVFAAVNDVEDMAEILVKMGYLDVARDMMRLSEYIRTAYNRIDVLSTQLKPVMKAVEWYEDSDISEDSMKKTIDIYRGDTK